MIGLRSYDAATGRLNILAVGPALDDWSVAALGFDYDRVGNLRERADWLTGLQETFVYDELNRLTNVNGPAPKVYAYDLTGNLTSKTDVGSYAYRTGGSTRPHAVTQISLPLGGDIVRETGFNYDSNGSLLNSTWQERNTQTQQIVRSGPGHTVTWTGFNMPAQIQTAGSNMLISYGPEHQKVKRVQGNGTLVYPLPNYEKYTRNSDGLIEHRHNLYAGSNLIGQYTERRGTISNEAVYYFHRDHLGSIAVISDEAGAPVERHSHDAFGLRRNPDGLDDPAGTLTSAITRIGYTGHEQLDNVRLIDMNARVYDPLVGRFLSADPIIPRPFDTQSHNRYSYVKNNPLSRIDPSGLTDYCAAPYKVHCSGERPAQTQSDLRKPVITSANPSSQGCESNCVMRPGHVNNDYDEQIIQLLIGSGSGPNPLDNVYLDIWSDGDYVVYWRDPDRKIPDKILVKARYYPPDLRTPFTRELLYSSRFYSHLGRAFALGLAIGWALNQYTPIQSVMQWLWDNDPTTVLFWRNLMIQQMLNPKPPSGGGFFRGAPGGGRELPIGRVTIRVPDKDEDEEEDGGPLPNE